MDRHGRLKEAYDYLRYQRGIHTQIDMANALQITRSSFSAAMNGNDKYLTKSLFMKICAAFPGVFNLDYLLTGEGTLLATQHKEAEPTPVSPATDNLLELHASLLRHVDDLRQSLHDELSEVQSLRQSLHKELSEVQSLRHSLSEELSEVQKLRHQLADILTRHDLPRSTTHDTLTDLPRSNNHDIGIAAETLDEH